MIGPAVSTLLESLADRPLALCPRRGPAALRGLRRAQAAEGFDAPPGERRRSPTGVLKIHGVLTRRGLGLGPEIDALLGIASYERIRAELARLLEDPQVAEIALDLDSPGGEVAGLFDLADELFAARQRKPMTAYANESAYSAAYALASAAGPIVLPRTGGVGSIGIVMAHVDYSGELEQAGIKVTLLKAGERKTDGNPFEPLSERARADLQAEIDRMYGLFVSSVARYRRMDPAVIRGTEAGTFHGQGAVLAGLADRVGTFRAPKAAPAQKSGGLAAAKPAAPAPTAVEDTDEPMVPAHRPRWGTTRSRGLR